MSWVVSKYDPEKGEKFEVKDEYPDRYVVYSNGANYSFLKSEYLPCPPPERWEVVPIQGVGCDLVLDALKSVRPLLCGENERFVIRDGALVLERKVGGDLA